MKQYSFQKEKRIHSNNQFVYLIRHGRYLRNKLLTIYIAKNDYDFPRLGISVGKFYGNALKRNKFKRLVREAFRLNQHKIPSGHDYLVRAGQKTHSIKYEQIKDAFLNLIVLDSNK